MMTPAQRTDEKFQELVEDLSKIIYNRNEAVQVANAIFNGKIRHVAATNEPGQKEIL